TSPTAMRRTSRSLGSLSSALLRPYPTTPADSTWCRSMTWRNTESLLSAKRPSSLSFRRQEESALRYRSDEASEKQIPPVVGMTSPQVFLRRLKKEGLTWVCGVAITLSVLTGCARAGGTVLGKDPGAAPP